MEIKFNRQVIGLNGQPLEGEHNSLAKIIANLLAFATNGNPTKMMDWARELYGKGTITTDRTDAEFLEAFIKESPTLPNLTKEQALELIKSARSENK